MKVKYIGTGGHVSYPCYEDEIGNIYFDISFGVGRMHLYTGAYKDEFGEICGEPNKEIKFETERID